MKIFLRLALALVAVLAILFTAACSQPSPSEVILATTTSTADSGLLDLLLPLFEQKTGYRVKPIAVGSGQAMALGERGEADVLLVHAADSEVRFMQAGHGVNRKLVMHNDFMLVGPPADPAGIKGLASAGESLKKIVAANAIFVSRGDNSGTHQLELKLWQAAGTGPAGTWYQSSGQGMGATLNIASEKQAYTITDRATYLAVRKNLGLEALVQGDGILLNIYHVIEVNPAKSARINAEGARAFAGFMISPETQAIIGKFGVEKFGEPLFVPDAGKTEAELGGV